MIKWVKVSGGWRSECGRFEIVRFIRRGGVEWGLKDNLVPVEPSVSGPLRTLAKAHDVALWRLANRRPSV